MPISYSGILDEHAAVRSNAGIFDVSHMGEFVLKGAGALDLIQRTTSNDASKLTNGKAQYSCLPNKEGGIVDDLIVYKMSDESYMLVVNASNIEKDWNWIQSQNNVGALLEDQSDDWSLLAIQGPKAIEAMQAITPVDLKGMKFYTFETGEFGGAQDVIISATGYTGSGGFEIYVKNKDVKEVWNAVFEAGKEFGIEPIGLGARDTLRLEMGFCLYGNDIDETTSPFEAGLGWLTKFTKDFVNSEALQAEKEAGIKNRLVGFELKDKGIPRQGYPIQDADGNEIGRVTSGTMSPSLGKAIGLGYVPVEYKEVGSTIYIGVRKKSLEAEVVKPPFYKG
jgi:aminomethyltransferase